MSKVFHKVLKISQVVEGNSFKVAKKVLKKVLKNPKVASCNESCSKAATNKKQNNIFVALFL